MSYGNYNLSLYRTGFRPYGHTNTWSASQLSGLNQVHAFGPWQLHGLGQAQPFTASGGWRLHGLGQQTVCLDQQENTVSCTDPECTYGDCGAADTGPIASGGCLNYSENQVLCTDPECRYGDCLSPTPIPAKGTITPAPGPAPRVTVPITLTPATSPVAPKPVALPTTSTLMQSTIIAGFPDVFLYAAGFLLVGTMLIPGGGKRR